MPFKSKKQEQYLRINEPEVYRDWKNKYGSYKGAESFGAETQQYWKDRGYTCSICGVIKECVGCNNPTCECELQQGYCDGCNSEMGAESFSADTPNWQVLTPTVISCDGACSMQMLYCKKCDEWFCEKCDDDHEAESHAETFNADSGFWKMRWVMPDEAYPRHMRTTDNDWAKDFYCDKAWVERHGDEYTLHWVVRAYKPTKVQRPAMQVFSKTYPYTADGWFNGYMRWAQIPMRGKDWQKEVQEKLGSFVGKIPFSAESFNAEKNVDCPRCNAMITHLDSELKYFCPECENQIGSDGFSEGVYMDYDGDDYVIEEQIRQEKEIIDGKRVRNAESFESESYGAEEICKTYVCYTEMGGLGKDSDAKRGKKLLTLMGATNIRIRQNPKKHEGLLIGSDIPDEWVGMVRITFDYCAVKSKNTRSKVQNKIEWIADKRNPIHMGKRWAWNNNPKNDDDWIFADLDYLARTLEEKKDSHSAESFESESYGAEGKIIQGGCGGCGGDAIILEHTIECVGETPSHLEPEVIQHKEECGWVVTQEELEQNAESFNADSEATATLKSALYSLTAIGVGVFIFNKYVKDKLPNKRDE